MSQKTRLIKNEIVQLIECHGYTIRNPESIPDADVSISVPGQSYQHQQPPPHILNQFITVAAQAEDVHTMPQMYDELCDFVGQVPTIQHLQLKPLLFAFFFHTVLELVGADRPAATEFYRRTLQTREPFHSFHDADLKKLKHLLAESSLQQKFPQSSFAISLTETTYHALVAFLMDRNFTRFLQILDIRVKVHFVPLDHFSRPDAIPGFVCPATDQAEVSGLTLIKLLRDNPIDLARRHLGNECTFCIFNDDPNDRAEPGLESILPNVLHDRVLALAADIQSMASLSKTNLPSIAFFTFSQECTSWDINGPKTLIAAATDRGYVKLFATLPTIDLDDDIRFSQVRSQSNHLLVPRQPAPFGQGTFSMRTLLGPPSFCVRFSPESRLLLSGGMGCVRLWPCETSAGAFCEIAVPSCIVWTADWSPLGYHFVTGCDDNCSWLWAIDRATPLRMFCGHREAVTDVKYHPNALTIATCSCDRSVMLWDIKEAASCRKMFADSAEVPRVLAFSRNGKVLFSGDDAGRISSWDIGEGTKIGTVVAHQGERRGRCGVRDLAVSEEGTLLASAGENGDVALWDMVTICGTSASGAEPLRRFQPRKAVTDRIAFSNRNLLHAIGTAKNPQP
jgi:transcription initiation factor TFIID subunit 5